MRTRPNPLTLLALAAACLFLALGSGAGPARAGDGVLQVQRFRGAARQKAPTQQIRQRSVVRVQQHAAHAVVGQQLLSHKQRFSLNRVNTFAGLTYNQAANIRFQNAGVHYLQQPAAVVQRVYVAPVQAQVIQEQVLPYADCGPQQLLTPPRLFLEQCH